MAMELSSLAVIAGTNTPVLASALIIAPFIAEHSRWVCETGADNALTGPTTPFD
jgi:hypothetical protein